MKPIPDMIDGANVVCASPVDERHHFTGGCKQIVSGQLMGAMAGLAICQYEGEDYCYLFGCDENWDSVTDTTHQSLEEALDQAEYEYTGIKDTMIYKNKKPNKALHPTTYRAGLGDGCCISRAGGTVTPAACLVGR
jgi:hypothetical protein